MAQLQHAPRRTTTMIPALAGLALLVAATTVGVLVIGQPGGLSFGQAAAPTAAGTNAAIQSGAVWQAQREQQSVYHLRLNRAKDAAVAAGGAWQAEREQQSVHHIRLNRAKAGAVQSGRDWQERYQQTNTIR